MQKKANPVQCWGLKDRETGEIDIWRFGWKKREFKGCVNFKFYKVVKVKISEVK